MSSDDDKALHTRAEEFLQVFRKGAEFTQELMRENERLRYRLVDLEQMNRPAGEFPASAEDSRKLLARIAELEREKDGIIERIRHVEAENKDFATRYVEISDENNNLANLYIASYQLHSTLDFNEVLQIITEIVINLIGAEEFAVMLLDEKTNELKAVATEGISADDMPSIKYGSGLIGKCASTGENHFVEKLDSYKRDLGTPMVCITLKIKEHVIGVIVIYKLLMQKTQFAELDYELFTLLAGHAATAIFASKLYSESERKLSTIQGFIGLLTK